ncbi:MAG: hypothetical protein KAR11_03135 [Phycisphaerae bacterium]|nr:hypothetical protein [Phycisphaerae bacterium]
MIPIDCGEAKRFLEIFPRRLPGSRCRLDFGPTYGARTGGDENLVAKTAEQDPAYGARAGGDYIPAMNDFGLGDRNRGAANQRNARPCLDVSKNVPRGTLATTGGRRRKLGRKPQPLYLQLSFRAPKHGRKPQPGRQKKGFPPIRWAYGGQGGREGYAYSYMYTFMR